MSTWGACDGQICYQYGHFIIELFLDFRSSMQHCAVCVEKYQLWRWSAKTIHFIWDGWFSDIIGERAK